MDPDKTRLEYWQLVENPIRSHIFNIDAKYDPDLIEAALNTRLHTSNFVADIGSTTDENEACRLFEAQAREEWDIFASTNSSQPRGVSDEILSKIWQRYHVTSKSTLDDTM